MKGKPISLAPRYYEAAVIEKVTAPPPCFHWHDCRSPAVCEKDGKSLCRACACGVPGLEYPLRPPNYPPLYLTGRLAAEDMDMVEEQL